MKRTARGCTVAAGMTATALALTLSFSSAWTAVAADTTELTLGDPSQASYTSPNKIDIMGLWAHPDDDASFTTPCGVWNDLYGIRCGIIMATRGEGGSNSVGPEAGPDLGLRRENEDRTSHYRSGTVDIFNLDRVDFFYNTSAPLTEEVWGHDETLRRTVRVIRETQPEILVGWPQALRGGHGNHQYAQGRMIWEAAEAAADPTMFPEQFEGVGAVAPWQVKKILAGATVEGEGGVSGPSCNQGFLPAATNPFTVVGTWTGYDSPYQWLEGNLAGIAAGTPKTWAQVGRERGRAHPTQERVMQKTVWDPTCQRYGVAQSLVPMQPNGTEDAARDDAILFGAITADPGGMPLGSLFYPEVADYFQAPGVPFQVTVNLSAAQQQIPAGTVTLDLPAGWDASGSVNALETAPGAAQSLSFTVTPSSDAAPGRYKIAARMNGASLTAYNDTRVEIVPAVEGRLVRSGLDAEYEEWATGAGSLVEGRSNAVTQIGAGESVTFNVEVTNRTDLAQSGFVQLDLPAGLEAENPRLDFADLGARQAVTLPFIVTHLDATDLGSRVEKFSITTESTSGTSIENAEVRIVPTAVISKLDAAPSLSGNIEEYGQTELDISTLWEGKPCDPDGTDCGAGSLARVGWFDDGLYFYTKVIDDIAGGAVTPERCFGHWITDSVELLLDPLGGSIDTASTFKLGIFPYTNDPTNWNGNGVDGACWSRDADNHQGFSSGPLAETVLGGLNAPGVLVKSHLERDSAGNYKDGQYVIEAKIPFDVLPTSVITDSAPTGRLETNTVDPRYLGMNITPYDSDNQNFVGKTRLAWSAFGSQQSEPLRWGHAYLEDYSASDAMQVDVPAAIIPDTALTGVESPQTIYQSAVRGATISGVTPTNSLTFGEGSVDASGITIPFTAESAGILRAFLWQGDPGQIPVWTSSCADDVYGFEACSEDDGAATPWGTDMGGRVKGEVMVNVAAGSGELQLSLEPGVYQDLSDDSMLLVSFIEDAGNGNGVDAWMYPIVEKETEEPGPGPEPGPDPEPGPNPEPNPGPEPGTDPELGLKPSPKPGTGSGQEGSLAQTGATVGIVLLAALGLGASGWALIRSRAKE